ncbi:hypothetical protein RhiirA4_483044 [Rhizophagus irregularis]|uniref:Uncharacterized protein n=1 Tax=Rhizophagus irregularis TaxID=588596 RepID=A0A2I1HLZ5_9GLOM|nr:hypothetical protein RhiirA4_483044 [Rhizophagus irregularis]
MIKGLKSLDIKADENHTSENLSEILESEDSQVSVKVNNEIPVSEDLNDYMIKD